MVWCAASAGCLVTPESICAGSPVSKLMNLIALAPGVVPQGSSEGPTTMNQGTHTNNAGWGNFQIGGGYHIA